MFRGNLDGLPLLHVSAALEAVAANGRPAPPGLEKCNRMAVPCGPPFAQGWVLMQLANVQKIQRAGLHTLHFELVDDSNAVLSSIDFFNLCLTREPINVTPSNVTQDPASVFLIELADSRWRCDNPGYCQSLNAQYNVRAPAYVGATTFALGAATVSPDSYYLESLDQSDPENPVPWLWGKMLEDIWGNLPALGDWPGLPSGIEAANPASPEGFVFVGTSAYQALNQVLTKLGLMLAADLAEVSNQYSIVQVGAPDAGFDEAIQAAVTANQKIQDAEYQPKARLAAGNARILFHRLEQGGGEHTTTNDGSQWQCGVVGSAGPPIVQQSGQPAYAIDVKNPDQTNSEPDVYHPIWDDLPAIFDAGDTSTDPPTLPACLNTFDLQLRANGRAADYFRLFTGGVRRWERYSGLLEIAGGSTVKGVAWVCGTEDGADAGVYTEIVNHPYLYMKAGTGASNWEECPEESSRLHAPCFRPMWPIYPLQVQIIRIGNGPNPVGCYDGVVLAPLNIVQATEGLEITLDRWNDVEDVWVRGLNTDSVYTPGRIVAARLVSYLTSEIPPPRLEAMTEHDGGSLIIDTAYYWAVTALVSEKESDAEDFEPVETPGGEGETPLSNQMTSTPTDSTKLSVTLVWSAVPGALSYNVYRNTTGKASDFRKIANVFQVPNEHTIEYTDGSSSNGVGKPSEDHPAAARPFYAIIGDASGPLAQCLADILCTDTGLIKTWVAR